MPLVIAAEATITAPPSVVWRVLTDLPRYAEWCTLLRHRGGRMGLGERLQLRLELPREQGSSYDFAPTVVAFEPERELAWLGTTGVRGVFDGRHRFVLTPVAGGTQLLNEETFTGLLLPIIGRMLRGAQPGYAALTAEIKARAEALARG